MRVCKCGSFAINEHLHGRERGVDSDLCDVCYWRKRALPDDNWISVRLAMPGIGQDVICFTDEQCFIGYRKVCSEEEVREWHTEEGEGWRMRIDALNADCHTDAVSTEVTHWMPLPDPPGGDRN